MQKSRSRVYGLTLSVLLFGLLICLAFATQVTPLLPEFTTPHFFASVLFFDRFYVDFLVTLLLGVILINGSLIFRIIAYVWIAIIFTGYLFQLMSVYIGGEFVHFLAVDNVNHITLLLDLKSISAMSAVAIFFVAMTVSIEMRCRAKIGTGGLLVYCGVIVFVTVALHQHNQWVPADILELRDGYYASKDNRIVHKSPIESLYKVLFRKRDDALKPLNSQSIARARSYGISINPDQRFPLIKPQIYSEPLLFETIDNTRDKPNVIIFFSEGLSARTLNVYNEFEPDLTPNMVAFSRHAMVVKNYYNHTYATYRGLLGQLCSIFPTHGGLGGWHTHFEDVKRINYFCLSDLFNSVGYETLFLDTHRADKGYVDEMMKQIRFDQVMTAETVVEKYIHDQPLRDDALSDNQLIDGLIGILKDKEQLQDTDSNPFFLGLYNLETHAWQKIAADGKKYPAKDNYVLDSIHNYDYAFGRFWDYFKDSSYFDNTVVVLTADHAHYADRDFVDIASKEAEYKPYFVDSIPLIIYDPNKNLPAEYDARYASSIDFAPSIAHWFGLSNGKNPFVGNSIFDQSRESAGKGIASADIEHYLINENGVEMNNPDGVNSPQMQFTEYLIKNIRQLEQHDRIWPQQ